MVTRTVTTTFDDITDQPEARQGWFAFSDGTKTFHVAIDLSRDNWLKFTDKFNRELAKYIAAGRVRRGENPEVPALSATQDQPARPKETRVVLAPQGETARVIRKAAVRQAGSPRTSPVLGSTGRPIHPSKSERPGIKGWWQRNMEILDLPDTLRPTGGRIPVVVKDAWDKWQGQDVTEDMLKADGRMTASKAVFSEG